MKDVLESILKIEEELKNKSLDAQKEAENILNNAKVQILNNEKEKAKEFEEYKISKSNELNNFINEYKNKLFSDVELEINNINEKISKKRDEIIQKILNFAIKD